MQTYTNTITDFDTALDFAYANRKSILFCGKMVRRFELLGNLTPNQINALLKIRSRKR
jgi:hypothetical protein